MAREHLAAFGEAAIQDEQLDPTPKGRFDNGAGHPAFQPPLSSVFSNNGATATPGIPATGAKETMEVSMRSCVRSSGSNCQSLTKIVQPGSEPGVWLLVGGLRT